MKIFDLFKKIEKKELSLFGSAKTTLYQSNRNAEALSKIGLVYKCIKLRSDSFANYNQRVLIDGKEVENHPIYEIFDSNINNSWQTIKSLYQQWYDINGNGYLWIEELSGSTKQIWVVPSTTTRVKINDYKQVSYTLNHKPTPKEQIIHIKSLQPSGDFFESQFIGKPDLLNASIDLIQVDKALMDYFERKLDKDVTTPYVLKTEHDDNDTKIRLKNFFNNVVPKEFQALAVLGLNDSLVPLGVDSGVSFSYDSRLTQESITAIWGVPLPILTGNHPNRNTADILEYTFEKKTVYPLVKQFNSELTRFFRRYFNDNRIEIVSDEPQYMDYEYYLREMQFDISYGLKTRNELRLERGLSEVPDGNVYYMNYSLVPVGIEPEKITLSKELLKREVVWKKIDDTVKPLNQKLQLKISRVFTALETEILENLNKKSITNLFELGKWTTELMKATEPEVRAILEKMTKYSLEQIGETDFDSFKLDISKAVKESTKVIGESIPTIYEDLYKKIEDIQQGNPTLSGDGLNSVITDTIKSSFKIMTTSRAKLISTTSTTFNTTKSQNFVFKRYGYKSQWLSQRDGDVRPTHVKADSTFQDDNGFFKVGADKMKHPAGGSRIEENANCRCYLFPVKDV